MIVSPTLALNVGPGMAPLKVWALAVMPLPMSTDVSSATIVVSMIAGSGLVSLTCGEL